jgi:Haem-degrading
MSSTLKIFGGMTMAMALWSSACAQGLVTEKNISLAMAQAIADGAMDKCKALGFKVSVVVVDRAGLPLVMLRGDGAGLHTLKALVARPTPRARSARPRLISSSGCKPIRPRPARRNTPACSRYPAVCQSRSATTWLERSAYQGHRAETTSAPRPASIK